MFKNFRGFLLSILYFFLVFNSFTLKSFAKDKKNVLVIGGAGYIGSHTCNALRRAGYNPIVFDNLSTGYKEFVQDEFIYGSLLDFQSISSVMLKYKFIAVMHFAAFSAVGESVVDPYKYYRNNVSGAANLLKAMSMFGINKIIFSSSAAVYGNPTQLPITEDSPRNPINPYGRSKLMIEEMLQDFHDAHGISYVSLRYFNAAGGSKDADIGENHNPETHLIPLVLDAALGNRKNITVYGTDYPTQDGTCIRDYIHVDDLADAHVKALDYLIKGGKSDYFNLGIGKGFSVKEVIESVKRVTGKDFSILYGKRRNGDPAVLLASNEKICKILKWKPKYTEIDEIITTALAWQIRKNEIDLCKKNKTK